ncbi:MAG TPA: hypothetical protein VG204_11535 [Terriglobia bacterium]|nr:hypothetical protein [Terriglobia bacterium]
MTNEQTWSIPVRIRRSKTSARRAFRPAAIVGLLCLTGAVALPGWTDAKEKPTRTYTIPTPPKPDFAQLDWLIGDWTGKTQGKDAQGDVHFSAAYEFDKLFMVLHEEVALPATNNAPATKESWMGILTGAGRDGHYELQVYSSTGFVTRYAVTIDEGGLYFNQQGGEDPPSGWLFRRVFEHTNPTEFVETVRVAPPDQAFFDYYSAKLTRAAAPAKSAAPAKPSKN